MHRWSDAGKSSVFSYSPTYLRDRGSHSYSCSGTRGPNTVRTPPFSKNSAILDLEALRVGRTFEYWGLAKPVGITTILNLGRKGLPRISGLTNWYSRPVSSRSFSKRKVFSPMIAISGMLEGSFSDLI